MFHPGDDRFVVYHHNDGIQFLGVAGYIPCGDNEMFAERNAITVDFGYVMHFWFGEKGRRQDADDEDDRVFHDYPSNTG
jgi:hypothetical protein